MTDRRALANVYVLLALVVALWSADALWGGGVWFFHDLRHHHYPWRAWAGRAWSDGELPLWAPVAHGYPLMADGQAGVLYPPNILLYLLLPEPLAYNWSVVAHHGLAAFGGVFLARVLGRSVPAAAVAGAAYGLSGFLVSHLVYLGMYQVIAWMPWMVAFTMLAVRAGGAWVAAAGLSIGVAWLAGHPQLALYASYAAGFAGLWEVGERWTPRRWRGVAALLAAVALAVVIASPQLLATAELTAFGYREGGVGDEFAAMGALPPEELVNGLFPYVFGFERPADIAITYHHRADLYVGRGMSFWEDCFYLGVPTVVLAVAAGRARRAWMWWLLLVAGLLVMLGPLTPAYALFRLLPGMDGLRFPARAAAWVTLAAGQLAAIGVDRLGGHLHAAPARAGRFAAIVMALAALGVGVAGVGWAVFTSQRADLERGLTEALVRPELPSPEPGLPSIPARGPEEAGARARVVLDEIEADLRPWGRRILWPALLGGGFAALVWLASRGRLPVTLPGRVAYMLIAIDLTAFGIAYNPRTPVDEVTRRPDTARVLLGEPGPFRTTVIDRHVPSELDTVLMSSNLGLLWGAEDVIIPSPLRTVRNETWLAEAGLDLGLVSAESQIEAFGRNRRLADISGVRFLVTPRVLDAPRLVERHAETVPLRDGTTATVRVYENLDVLPRAWAAGCTVVAAGADDALAKVKAVDDPRFTAVIEGAAGLSSCHAGPAGRVDVERVGRGALRIVADLERDGWLVVTETLYPGMRFVVDGEAREPVRTNSLFQGVALGPGRHEIELAYRPTRLYVAMAIAAAAFAAALGWIVVRRPNFGVEGGPPAD